MIESRAAWRMLAAALFLVAPQRVDVAHAAHQPRVAIISCQDTYVEDWYSAHASSQSLVGLAGLVGVPYRTLTLEGLIAAPDHAYTSLWFGACSFVAEQRIDALVGVLGEHLQAGGSVLLDGALATSYRAGDAVSYRSMAQTFPFLGIEDAGWQATFGHSIHTTASRHPIAARAQHPAGAQLTQGVAGGMTILRLGEPTARGSDVLLELRDPESDASRPYLLVTEPGPGARVLAIAAYGHYSGPASPFRNRAPAGFHDNLLLPYLVDALLWLVGPADGPFVGLQLSHAPMTVIGRLDGDWSGHPEATRVTLDYLIALGQRTGVATIYGVVSSFADSTGWQGFDHRIEELQRLGGSIGSHSRTHPYDMSNELAAYDWALEDVRAGLRTATFTPDALAFINPGNTIQSRDYHTFFADVALYLTHGMETYTPYASGVMGFGLPEGVPARPVINNTPVPDFQWLYMPEWVYSLDQIADNQRRILTYYQERVGRGVLYNQMWHDYALSDLDPPLHVEESPRLLFDVNRDHFDAHPIYAPSVRELIDKMHAAREVAITSVAQGAELVATLDLRQVPAARWPHLAGMGARVHGAEQPIREVRIDGDLHHAFSEHTVILPAATRSEHTLTVRFGAPSGLRLSHISKPSDHVELTGQRLVVRLRHPGLATQLCVHGPPGTVLLHADSYARAAGGALCGRVHAGSDTPSVEARALDTGACGLGLTRAERRIDDARMAGPALHLQAGAGLGGRIELTADAQPDAITIDGALTSVTATAKGFSVAVPATPAPVAVSIRMPARCAPDIDEECLDPGARCASAGCGAGCATSPGQSGAGLAALLCLCGWAALGRGRRSRP